MSKASLPLVDALRLANERDAQIDREVRLARILDRLGREAGSPPLHVRRGP